MQDAVAGQALRSLVAQGGGLPVDAALSDLRFLAPIAAPQKIICIGVNYPDRNEEYKDGQKPAA